MTAKNHIGTDEKYRFVWWVHSHIAVLFRRPQQFGRIHLRHYIVWPQLPIKKGDLLFTDKAVSLGGWIRASDCEGNEGFVPWNYIEYESNPVSKPVKIINLDEWMRAIRCWSKTANNKLPKCVNVILAKEVATSATFVTRLLDNMITSGRADNVISWILDDDAYLIFQRLYKRILEGRSHMK